MSLAEHVRRTEVGPRIHRETVPETNFSLPRGFEPIELAGMGAFAEVWKAMEESSGRLCALKRLRPERCDESIARQLIELLRSDVRAEVPYLVFEWTDGRTLEDELQVEEKLSLRRSVWIARQA